MKRVRDLLNNSRHLPDAETALLVKFIWLSGRVSDDARERAMNRVLAYFPHEESDWPNFMREVRTVILDLELAQPTPNDPQTTPDDP